MKIVPLQIYLLMVSSVTESVRNTAVSLGSEVIISCDLDIKDVYWIRHKSPDSPEIILRTFSSTSEDPEYKNDIFEPKYSVKTNSRLWIRNISTDESGVYYCVKTSEPLKFSNGTRIYINDSVPENQRDCDDDPHHETQWRNLAITSVLINGILIIAVIGLAKVYLDVTKRSKKTSEKPENINDLQYAEVDFSKRSRRTRPCPRPDQDQTTYSLLQPVKTV
ncbi:uncharacterized protein LOC122327852 [Puntigrus tetrazona]|uniref:uncharacterized protein LOC122327852 n=1 Tax=Puntigrus tetrazona TaxID=1606681 RepID=UPI001C891419|nr:uncharacterized protein LOC122327852 [Puntigrus tetrazona]